MSSRRRRGWRIRVGEAAEADIHDIVEWTADRFGARQARVYARTIALAVGALVEGPEAVGAKERAEIADGLFTIHVARGGRRGRHFVLFRCTTRGDEQIVDILRILHDAMDLVRHVEPSGDDS